MQRVVRAPCRRTNRTWLSQAPSSAFQVFACSPSHARHLDGVRWGVTPHKRPSRRESTSARLRLHLSLAQVWRCTLSRAQMPHSILLI